MEYKEIVRIHDEICASQYKDGAIFCRECPLKEIDCRGMVLYEVDKFEEILIKWVEEHPKVE